MGIVVLETYTPGAWQSCSKKDNPQISQITQI